MTQINSKIEINKMKATRKMLIKEDDPSIHIIELSDRYFRTNWKSILNNNILYFYTEQVEKVYYKLEGRYLMMKSKKDTDPLDCPKKILLDDLFAYSYIGENISVETKYLVLVNLPETLKYLEQRLFQSNN